MLTKKQQLDLLDHNDYHLPANPWENMTKEEVEYILQHPNSALKHYQWKTCPFRIKCNKQGILNAIHYASAENLGIVPWITCPHRKPKVFMVDYLYSVDPAHTLFSTTRKQKKKRNLAKPAKHPRPIDRPLPIMIPRNFAQDAQNLFGIGHQFFDVGFIEEEAWMRFDLGNINVRHRIIKKISKLITLSQKISYPEILLRP